MATACLSLALSKATKASLCLPMVRPLCIEARLGQSEQPSSNLAYAGRTARIRSGAFLTKSDGGTALSRAQGARGTDITSRKRAPGPKMARGDSLRCSENPGSNLNAGLSHQRNADLSADDRRIVAKFHALRVGVAGGELKW